MIAQRGGGREGPSVTNCGPKGVDRKEKASFVLIGGRNSGQDKTFSRKNAELTRQIRKSSRGE